MNKITKEMCTVLIQDSNMSKSICLIFLSLFLLVPLWLFTKNIIIVAVSAVLLLALSIFAIYTLNQKNKNIDLNNFYLVEDVVVDFKKKFSSDKGGGSGCDYIYTFRDYGSYTIHKSVHPTIEIPLHKDKIIDYKSLDNLCIDTCEKGDIFYLLISNEKTTKIIKCFPKYHFDILKEDFEYIDGKYCFKNS